MQWKFLNPFGFKRTAKQSKPPRDLTSAFKDIAHRVKRIEILTKKNANLQLAGQYKSRFKGQGMQFSDVRVYQFGDDVRHIDWRSSARSQQVYIRTYEEEREINVICAVDISASTWFGSEQQTKKEALALGIAAIAFAAAKNRDKVGLLLYTNEIERYVPPKSDQKHIMRIIDEVLSFKAMNKGTDHSLAMRTIGSLVKHNSIIIMASDFHDFQDQTQVKRVARKHDLITMHIHDPKEVSVPKIGLIRLEDPETGEIFVLDSSASFVQKHFASKQSEKIEDTANLLKMSGASYIQMTTVKNPIDEIAQFFHRRKQSIK